VAPFAIVGATVFDGRRLHHGCAVVVDGERIAAVVPHAEAPANRIEAEGATLSPGFVDWQVNGGGGVLLNDAPTPEGVAAIAAAHACYGTTALLPTLITDRPAVMDAVAAATVEAIRRATPGVAGVHFEGPHLATARRGAHDAGLFRPPGSADLRRLAGPGLGCIVATVAPEVAADVDIAALARAGVLVSLGHSDASYNRAMAAFAAGASAATHLFNAMSGLNHREPGLVGAALDHPHVWAGIIADGWHVHPAALRTAMAAKRGGRLTLVTDAMPTVGAAGDVFTLGGRTVTRRDGRLTLPDGTLAGSDLDMASAVRGMITAGATPARALAMATSAPARMLGLWPAHGLIAPGSRADLVALDRNWRPVAVWIGGRRIPRI
jgi:N-acetylglucosamine-6-phosphate deacetylase